MEPLTAGRKLVSLLLCFIGAAFISPLRALDVLYMAQASYQPQAILERAEAWSRLTGEKVNVRFVEYRQLLESAREAATLGTQDVILLDLIWMRRFLEQGLLDPVPPEYESKIRTGVFPRVQTPFRYDGKLWAYPFIADFQLLYTNMDMLAKAGFFVPPSTPGEFLEMAERAKALGLVRYPVFLSLDNQEILVCMLELWTGVFGGDLQNACTGKAESVKTPLLSALTFLRTLMTRGLLNPASLESDEMFASEVFLYGDCLFTTNWNFLSGRMKSGDTSTGFRGRLSALPAEGADRPGRGSSVSGYQAFSVPMKSPHKASAWKFIDFLAAPDFQKQYVDELPVWMSLWDDPVLRKADPFAALKRNQIMRTLDRPMTVNYDGLSARLRDITVRVLTGNLPPADGTSQILKELIHAD